jgi:hypothetical protein
MLYLKWSSVTAPNHLGELMGSFANSMHVQSNDCTAVADAIRAVLLAEGYEATNEELPQGAVPGLPTPHRALHVSQARQGWVSVLDSEMISPALASALSGRLNTHVLQFLVNDSDAWYYQLYREGQKIDEFASDGSDEDGDEDEDDFEDATDVAGRVHAGDAQRIIMEKAVQWQKELEKRITPEMRQLQEKWKKTGRVSAEEMQQYQEWMRKEVTPVMGDLRSLLGEFAGAARASGPQPPGNDKLQAHLEHLKPLLPSDVPSERVLGVLGKHDLFAEETLGEFLSLVGIASYYAYLSYPYLREQTTEELARHSIQLIEHLKFKKSNAAGKGRLRVVR